MIELVVKMRIDVSQISNVGAWALIVIASRCFFQCKRRVVRLRWSQQRIQTTVSLPQFWCYYLPKCHMPITLPPLTCR